MPQPPPLTYRQPSQMTGRSGTQTVERVLALLACFETEAELGVTQSARLLALSVSTTHRLLQSLKRGGLLAQGRSGRYHLAARTAALGALASQRLGFDTARPVLEDLARQTGDAVTLGIIDSHSSLIIACAPATRDDGITVEPSTRSPLHACAMGKTILAFTDPLRLRLDAGPLAPVTERTITDPAALAQELQQIRQRGWALNDEELISGVRGVSAPVRDTEGQVVAALAVAVPRDRLTRQQSVILARLVRISAARLHGTLVDVSGGKPATQVPAAAYADLR